MGETGASYLFEKAEGASVGVESWRKEREKKCSKCEVSFFMKGHLTVHTRAHAGVKPFECNICGFVTERKTNLLAHHTTHSGGVQFDCSDCTFSTKWRSSLIRHKKSKHPICDDWNSVQPHIKQITYLVFLNIDAITLQPDTPGQYLVWSTTREW